MDSNLKDKLLIYVGYILPRNGFNFSYVAFQKLLEDTGDKNCHLSTLRKEYSLLKKNGLIEFKSRYRKSVPVLTQKGKLAIKTNLSFKSYDAWDERWRMVIFGIPETERKYRLALRIKLTGLGFGNLQNSVYISPYPLLGSINRFASEMGIRQYLRLVEVDKIDDEKRLVEKAWNLENINEKYISFIDKFKKIKKDIYWPLFAKKLEQEFVDIYKTEPHLPERFLPKNWQGKIAYDLFKTISNSY